VRDIIYKELLKKKFSEVEEAQEEDWSYRHTNIFYQ
jgi:hypothetical protein